MKMKKWLTVFCLVMVLVIALAGCSGNGGDVTPDPDDDDDGDDVKVDPIVLTAADVVAPEAHLGQAMDFFAEKVFELSEGKVKVDVYHGGALGNERDILEGVLAGSIHFAAPGGGVLGIFYPPSEIFTYPYLFKDRDHADRVWKAMLPEFSAELERSSGFKGLTTWNRPARQLSASKPVNTVDDMKGLKVRVPETKMWMQTFERFGANPTPLAFTEVYTALQTGLIDGQDNPIILTYNSGFFEVNKYFNLIEHMMQDNILVTNSAWFVNLDADLQEAISEAARLSFEHCAALSIAEEKRLLAEAEKMGVTIVETDQTGFREAVDGMIDDFPAVKKWYDFAKAID